MVRCALSVMIRTMPQELPIDVNVIQIMEGTFVKRSRRQRSNRESKRTSRHRHCHRRAKKFSPGESVGIALGVGLAIGLLLGVGIMARRNSKGRPLREGMDAGALDADGSSTIQKVTTVGNAQKGHEDIAVEEIEENEVI